MPTIPVPIILAAVVLLGALLAVWNERRRSRRRELTFSQWINLDRAAREKIARWAEDSGKCQTCGTDLDAQQGLPGVKK